MNLIDKLKNAGKALALAGGLGGMVYNSGCMELAVLGAGKMIADSNVKAAEIEARGGYKKINPKLQSSNQDLFLTCNYSEDLDCDNRLDKNKEIFGIKDKFYLGERMTFLAQIKNKRGSYLSFELYKIEDNQKIKMGEDKNILIKDNSRVFKKGYPKGLPKGFYLGVWKAGDEQVGTNVVEFKDI